jgi:hypothetical protein
MEQKRFRTPSRDDVPSEDVLADVDSKLSHPAISSDLLKNLMRKSGSQQALGQVKSQIEHSLVMR